MLRIAIACTTITGDPENSIYFLQLAKSNPDILTDAIEGPISQLGQVSQKSHLTRKEKDGLVSVINSILDTLGKSVDFDAGLMSFDRIGGYGQIKEILKLYSRMFADPERASLEGVEGITGIIIGGPPGTGKTLLAEAFMNEALKSFGARKYQHYEIVTGATLLSPFYSMNERNVHNLFRRARKNAPYIILVDEGDELFLRRGEGHNADTSTTSQLLTEIGGLQREEGVIVIITTNRIEAIDEAAMRYGRLGVHFKLDNPSYDDRMEIAKIHLERHGRRDIIGEFDLEKFAKATEGLSGADIAGVIGNTYFERYRRMNSNGGEAYKLNTCHFLESLDRFRENDLSGN